MKKFFRKILSIVLIPILLFSTTSFSIFKHECGDQLYSLSITGHDEGCGMDMNTIEESCELTSVKDFIDTENSGCCKSDVAFISGSQTNLDSEIQITNLQLKVIRAYVFTYLNLYQVDISSAKNYNYYSPPITVKDIAVLYQIFKI